jgi:anthranilate synthase component I
LMADHRAPEVPGLPRFYGGAVGFATYDMARHFEDLPRRTRDDLKLPDYVFMFTRDMFIFDHLNHTVRLVRCVRVPRKATLEKLHAAAGRDLLRLARSIRLKPLKLAPMAEPQAGAVPEDPAERRAFMAKVEKAKEYISAGDVIQVVLSRRRAFAAKADPLEIYRALRRINPSPYMYFLKDGKTQVVGSSPEMLVRLEGRRAETRPIAGTRRRSADAAADLALEKELLADAKERAEHLMLVDLSRNDLGRVCRPGTVRVPDFMFVERYSHVMHLVSSVVGELAPEYDALDLFRAVFPAGTLSGAPKIRAMEIIEELEESRRGLYGGAVGYFSYTGNMDMAITIRTLLLRGGRGVLQAGAGIVADSDPAAEYQETDNKAQAVLSALRAAGMRA